MSLLPVLPLSRMTHYSSKVAGARGGDLPVATISQQVAESEEEREQKLRGHAQLLKLKVGYECLCPRAGMWEGPPVA